MQWASTVAEDDTLEVAADKAILEIRRQLGDQQPDLVIAFASQHYSEDYGQVPALLRARLGSSALIGCSAGGVIGGGREVEQRPGFSLTAAWLPGVVLTPFYLEDADVLDSGSRVEDWEQRVGVAAVEQPHFLLFADPYSFNPEPLLRGLDWAFPESRKIGGLASGAMNDTHALYLDAITHRSGLVGVAMHGNIQVDTIVAQGCRPIGEPMFVTSTEDNELRELDGRPPLMVLQELYQSLDEQDQELCKHSLFLGIAMREASESYRQGDFLIRNIIGMDPQSGVLAVGAMLKQNSVVQFHLRDAQTSAEDLETLLGRFDDIPESACPKGSLLFSCLGRGMHLYGHPDHDTDALRRHLGEIPLGGFFCNGEIGPVQGSTFLHGYTSSFGLFRPK